MICKIFNDLDFASHELRIIDINKYPVAYVNKTYALVEPMKFCKLYVNRLFCLRKNDKIAKREYLIRRLSID